MKRFLPGAIAALVLGVVAAPAIAVQYGQLPPRERDGGGVVPIDYGTYKATVKKQVPLYVGPDGTYHVWAYHHLTSDTLQGCVQQVETLLFNPGTYVVEYCHKVD